MILECEKCATRYLVDTADIGVLGRMVRCAECGHDWFATTDGAAPSPQPAAAAPQPIVDEPAASAEPHEQPQTENRNLPAIVEPVDHRPAMILLMGTMLLVLAVLYLAFGRAQIIALWPPARHAYAVIGLEEAALVDVPQQQRAVPIPEEVKEEVAVEITETPVVEEVIDQLVPAAFALRDVGVVRKGDVMQIGGVLQNTGGEDSAFPQLLVTEFGDDEVVLGERIHRLNPAYEPLVAGGEQPFTLYHGLMNAATVRVSVTILPLAP